MPSSRPADQRPLLLTAAWAGLSSALVASVTAVVTVAVLWLPAASGSGSAGSAIRAGIITFLAGVHGGVTVDGVASGFVPLGLTMLVVAFVWRASTAVAAHATNSTPRQLVQAVAAQSAAFALTCALLAAASGLGTSSASVAGAFGAGLLLTAITAGAALLRTEFAELAPAWARAASRAAFAALAVYLAVGAVLVAGALVVHHERVAALSSEVGGGWSSVPVLVLGVLAAPNAVIAGAGYLSGAGFAVGTATTVSLTGTTSGLVPAFPILGALPDGSGSHWLGWLLAAATPLAAGAAVAAVVGRAPSWRERWTSAGVALAGVAVLGAATAWQGGGGIGSGKLRAVGTSPWQFALLTAAWVGVATALWLGVRAGVAALRRGRDDDARQQPTMVMRVARTVPSGRGSDADSVDERPDNHIGDDHTGDGPADEPTDERTDEAERRDDLAG